MASFDSTLNNSNSHSEQNSLQSYRSPLIVLTLLFFIWGFITSLNDILIPHLRNVFDLSYTQAMLVQFCFFFAYFICSIPAGALVNRLGYQRGIVVGLIIAAVGCLLFVPAASLEIYGLFLGALFILASGITILQVSANPYVTLLGPTRSSSSRLNLTQAFNSLGTAIAPVIGGALILAAVGTTASGAAAVRLPYIGLGLVLLALAVLFAFLRLPVVNQAQEKSTESILAYRHLVLGAIAIFVYVGAEVSIGSFIINFIGEPDIAGLEEVHAAIYVSYYWTGAMVGRFVSVLLMRKFAANLMLAAGAILAVSLLIMVISLQGSIAMWSLVLVGLCNSLMFPTIFSLALKDLGSLASKGSGLLCLMIVGGAILPLLQGVLADTVGLQLSFILPLLCYMYIAYYGFYGCKRLMSTTTTAD